MKSLVKYILSLIIVLILTYCSTGNESLDLMANFSQLLANILLIGGVIFIIGFMLGIAQRINVCFVKLSIKKN
jgi:hypothetical protein